MRNASRSEEMKKSKQILEPPNGGWGWAVVFGSHLTNVFNQAVPSIFGLMFGPYFTSLNESKSRIALVMNLSSAFLNLTGLFIAPIIRNFTPRKVTVSGSLLVSFGLMLSSFTTSLQQTFITYSLMVGVGLGLIAPALFMAVSSYFTTKKSRAFGFSLAGACIGQMILPHIVRILLTEYGFRGTVLIMGSLSLHGVVGAFLFQPVDLHMKVTRTELEEELETESLMHQPAAAVSSESGFWSKLAKTMDLSLLKDVRFVILNIGVACAYSVSMDFSLILPFFLQVCTRLKTLYSI